MCGIVGYYSTSNAFTLSELKSAGESIALRGPQHQGIYSDECVGLAHRRLKIIDLSDDANQPMISEDGRYVIAFNGEVYNYDEIRREQQLQVKTASDTEIVLKTLISDNVDALEYFNGMFAIAFYDSLEKELLLIRDRMGVKPLYYYWDGVNFAFASEIKALLQFDYINKNKSIEYNSINQFLHLGYTGTVNTIYKYIYKVPAGSYLELSENGLEIKTYWSTYEHVENKTFDDLYSAKEILRDLVEQSVRYRLKSDVPYGTFLSGGIDSSLVTAVAQRNLSSKLNTFTIAFAESKYDESKYAREIANFLGTNHTEMVVTQKEASEMIPTILDTFDEPFADSSAIPTMLVSKLAKTKATMVLSGDGGDELFMGYGAYNWAKRLENSSLNRLRMPIYLASRLGTSRVKRAGNVLAYPSESMKPSHIFSQEQCLFSRKEIKKILIPKFQSEICLPNEIADVQRRLSSSENQALFDMNYYLREDLLTKVDRSSMKYSLEVRVPLLDYNIVEFALNLNENLKLHNGTQKYLLRQVLYDYVPSNLFDRPKWGFSIPLCEWLHKDLHHLIDDYLNKQLILNVGVFNYKYVRSLVRRFDSGRNDCLYNRIWQIILVQKFICEKLK
ncbi:MAG: asparagine synthase (glutamine-hydrolyzing) [Bacteroidales bacterium]|nr:asparagine synthase (glutamine-hydrolyzing) [Bacteroidales bacterium]